MTTEEKLNRFLETSINDVRQQSSDIIAKYTKALSDEFEEYKNSINNEIEQHLKYETNKIRVRTNRELAEKQIEIKRKISKKQEELKGMIFAEVGDKLAAFKSTPAYYELLMKQIKEAVAFAGTDEILIYIDPVDKEFLSSLKNIVDVPIEVSTYSFSGGTRALIKSKNIIIDNSFKNKLEEANESFTFYGGSCNE